MKYSLLLLSFFSVLCAAQNGNKTIELSDFTKDYTFTQRDVYGIRSMNDGKHYTVLENKHKIVKYSYSTGKAIETIFDVNAKLLEDAKLKKIDGYTFSKDEKFILVHTNTERIYRRSYTAEYWLYDVRRKRIEPIEKGQRQQMATLSPNSLRVAFARDNNLFIKDLRFGTVLQITDDGEKNSIINGIPDWVYEEEFSMNKSFEWSPNGQFLAYVKYDESEVREYSFPSYPNSESDSYPHNTVFKYPRAGETNSTVSVHVYNTDNRITRKMNVSDENDIYIPRIRWTASAEQLSIMKLNRHQNQLELYLANPKSGVCRMIMKENNDRYITETNFDYFRFLDDDQHFVWASEKDGFNHLYLYSKDGSLVKQLTNGNWDVTNFYGYDAKRKLYYYQAAAKSPLEREIYAIDLKGKNKRILSSAKGTNSASFSSDFSYFIKRFSDYKTPRIVSLCNNKGETLRVLEENTKIKNTLSKYKFTQKTFFTFETNDNIKLNGWMIKPHHFDSTQTYPVLMVQYSGPGSQEVLNSWEFGWEHFLAEQGYIVACVDGRGTGARGEEFKKCTYLNLGKLETIDQAETAKYLGSLDYVDHSKIGIWGWSYGGFMSALCLSRGTGLFKMGISVAPVTHYKYYDSIYTERFMRTYGENPKGYDENSPLMLADKLEGELLLCHGTGDDNVHYQNTIDYSEALVQADKQFEMQLYRNRAHSISGGNTRHHLFTRMFNFMERTLK